MTAREKMELLRTTVAAAALVACFDLSAFAEQKKEGDSASCSCYCKSKTAEGVSVALPKILKAPDGDLTKCAFLAGFACKNAIPDDVSYGTLSLCQGRAESRRPATRAPGKLPLQPLEQLH